MPCHLPCLVRSVLIFVSIVRFQTNQFEFDNGAGPNGGPSAALYHFTSNMNHSCSPTVYLKPTKGFLQMVGAPLEEDGMIVARALVDLVAGDECSINYGPLELVEWPVEQRRAYTTDKLGFICMCMRCVEESNR